MWLVIRIRIVSLVQSDLSSMPGNIILDQCAYCDRLTTAAIKNSAAIEVQTRAYYPVGHLPDWQIIPELVSGTHIELCIAPIQSPLQLSQKRVLGLTLAIGIKQSQPFQPERHPLMELKKKSPERVLRYRIRHDRISPVL